MEIEQIIETVTVQEILETEAAARQTFEDNIENTQMIMIAFD